MRPLSEPANEHNLDRLQALLASRFVRSDPMANEEAPTARAMEGFGYPVGTAGSEPATPDPNTLLSTTSHLPGPPWEPR